VTDEEIAALARAAGFRLESWMTNPPKPMLWHGTPQAMRALVEAVISRTELASSEKWNDGAGPR
jgi:hypothetical protein